MPGAKRKRDDSGALEEEDEEGTAAQALAAFAAPAVGEDPEKEELIAENKRLKTELKAANRSRVVFIRRCKKVRQDKRRVQQQKRRGLVREKKMGGKMKALMEKLADHEFKRGAKKRYFSDRGGYTLAARRSDTPTKF